jgi:GTP 3',8-cyclase
MLDKWGRNIDYLKISINDRCNLNCIHCVPKEDISYTKKDELLTVDEIVKIVQISSNLGITKIGITGEEPLLVEEIEDLIYRIKNVKDIKQVCINTKGAFLYEKLDSLAEVGLDGINIKLETLKCNTCNEIRNCNLTGVLKGINKALEKGIEVKINSINLKEYNDIMNFIKTSENSTGKIGFTSPFNHLDCKDCNRIKITADGIIKQCLFFNSPVSIKKLIREGIYDEDLENMLKVLIYNKPYNKHCLEKNMNQISRK